MTTSNRGEVDLLFLLFPFGSFISGELVTDFLGTFFEEFPFDPKNAPKADPNKADPAIASVPFSGLFVCGY